MLGQRRLQAGDWPGAERDFQRIVRDEPGCAEAWFFLGLLCQQQHDPDTAIAHYRRALRLAPDLAEAHNNLGVLIQSAGHAAEGEACFREAVRLQPDYPEALNNLGNALQDQGRYTEAVEAYREALRSRPGYVDALKHLGNALRALGRVPEAIACYEAGLRLAPDHVGLHTSRALLWLQEGDYERGWTECEWRLRNPGSPGSRINLPLWDGSFLEGRTILVLGEQGLGDVIQFLRYIPLIAARGGRVVLACASGLARIARTCPGVAEVIADTDSVPGASCYVPLMSLPVIFRTRLETIPATVPYLDPGPEQAARWSEELGKLGGFKIGVVWQGNPQHRHDRERSFPLAKLEAVARVPGVRLFSLQKNFGLDQLADFAHRFPITDLDPFQEDFLDTAAMMRGLDLVITADSSPAHLAGALNVPVWVALSFTADWRWMTGRDDSPWYPSLRLFRQSSWGDWDGLFARMAVDLARLAACRTARS